MINEEFYQAYGSLSVELELLEEKINAIQMQIAKMKEKLETLKNSHEKEEATV